MASNNDKIVFLILNDVNVTKTYFLLIILKFLEPSKFKKVRNFDDELRYWPLPETILLVPVRAKSTQILVVLTGIRAVGGRPDLLQHFEMSRTAPSGFATLKKAFSESPFTARDTLPEFSFDERR
jgi:hypothetical protein